MPNEDLPVSTAAPLGLHPQEFLGIEGVDDDTLPFLAPAIEAFDTAVQGFDAIREARLAARKNNALTEEAKLLVVGKYAEKKVPEITRKIDHAHDLLKSQIAFTVKALQQPLEATVHTSTAAELRALVRAMPTAERRKLVTDSIAAMDMLVLGSVLSVHPLLSGLTEVERTAYTRQYRERSQPVLANRLRVMQKAFDILGERGGQVLAHAEKLIGADSHKLKALRAAESTMQRALAR